MIQLNPESMVGDLNEEQINSFLRSQVIGRIGCSRADMVYLVPITYSYDGEYLYFHTNEGLKTQIMRENPKVCFEVDQVTDLCNWQSVIVNGIFEELKTKDAVNALRHLNNRLAPLRTSETFRPIYGLKGVHSRGDSDLKLVVFRIRIERMSGKYEKS